MSLTHIEYGSLASSEIINDNLEYLDNRITTLAESLTSTSSSFYSNVESLNNTLSQQNSELSENLADLESDLEQLTESFNAQNNSPDYSAGIGITMPYTVPSDGYVYAGIDGTDTTQYVYVNGSIVHGHCGYSGGKFVYSGSTFRVSQGDIVSVSRGGGTYYFYPMKGV